MHQEQAPHAAETELLLIAAAVVRFGHATSSISICQSIPIYINIESSPSYQYKILLVTHAPGGGLTAEYTLQLYTARLVHCCMP